MSRLNKVVEKELERAHGLDMAKVIESHKTMFDSTSNYLIGNEISTEEKVILLYSIKSICITYGIEKPRWWYSQRNTTNWQDENGELHYGYDLGGF